MKLNAKMTNFIKSTKGFITKHSPEILTGIGVAGMITSTVLAVKATPRALYLIEDEIGRRNEVYKDEARKNGKEICQQIGRLNTVDTIKVAWKPYIPAVLMGVASVSCIIGASRINTKRNAALATAYSISERALVRYRDKVIETIGEKKEKEVREKVAQDEVDKNPISGAQVIITPKGNTLFKDSISGRYFKSDLDTIKKAVIKLNMEISHQNYISLNEFYGSIGLDSISNGDYLGWNIDDGYVEIEYDTCLVEDEPCIVLDYRVAPKYGFDTFA